MNIPINSKLLIKKGDDIQKAQVLSFKPPINGEEAQLYIHYDGFNKRLDEWVPLSWADLDSLEVPKVKKVQPKKNARNLLALGKGKAQRQDDASAENSENEQTGFSKEKEIEKLRTSGSMTQSLAEISRVKNIQKIQFGKHEIETWYFSPYPEEYSYVDLLYICEFCLEPVGSYSRFSRHRLKCTLRHPPGNEIYRHDQREHISFFEIDGRKQRGYTRNLCLLSKLFLDHKTLYYDVDPFLFYLMVRTDEYGSHLLGILHEVYKLGYFSKEKQSADDYNVACILTMPQYQRMGYGKVLIEFSYELSKVEKKTGSPEKPLSDLGLLSYRSYWTDILLEKLIDYQGEVTISELSDMTSFTTDDILSTLQHMDVIRYFKGQFVICISDPHILQFEKLKKKSRIRIEPTKLEWTPPKFAPNQLRYI